MHKASILRVSSPSVISEVIEREAVIVNLDSGAYYSVAGAGTEIWEVVQHEGTVADAIQYVAASYSGSEQEIAADVTRFIQQLNAEGIIALAEMPDANRAAPFSMPASDLVTRPFAAPILEKYTDMAELLLLDPVHEVNKSGWPKPRVL